MTTRSWQSHTLRLLLWAVVIGFIGWMAGYPAITLAIAALAYFAWTMANLWRLYRWILHPDRQVPESIGLWADIFDGINSMEKSDRGQQEQYQASIDQFRSLVDAFPDAMVVVDKDHKITWCNTAAVQLLGFRVPEDVSRPITSVLRDPDLADWMTGQPEAKSPLDMPSPRGSGRWLTVSAVSIRESQRLIILRNITGIHNVEQIRRDFVANISHELRTPLTVLRGYLELLDGHPSEDVSEPVKRMLGPALQMQTLLDDLLELSRLQSEELRGEDELVNVPAILRRLMEQAEGLSRGDHRIEFHVDTQLFLQGVAPDIESAFSNLITNAIKYTPKGGSVTVTWEPGDQGPQLQVRDTGIGIPSRDVPRVTERFYRVGSDRARETGGTGLGLAIVKHVLNAHQARLIIISELGLGSEFTCKFPANRARSTQTSQ